MTSSNRPYDWPPRDQPPNGGIPPGAELRASTRPISGQVGPLEPPGGHFHGQSVDFEGVRALFPPNTAVFHVMNGDFMKGLPSGYMQPWEFPTSCTVEELCVALGVKGVKEFHDRGAGQWIGAQTFFARDTRAATTLKEVGWAPGRGFKTPPVWIEVLE